MCAEELWLVALKILHEQLFGIVIKKTQAANCFNSLICCSCSLNQVCFFMLILYIIRENYDVILAYPEEKFL